MKTSTLRRKRVVIPALATVAVLAAGGTVWAASADDVSGDERTRVAAAAEKAAGGGEAVDVERSDDLGEAYEVEVRQADGTEVDVTLDDDLAVVTRDHDDEDDADDRMLTAAERAAVEKAALAAVGGGTLIDADPSDDPGVAYEAEVRDGAGVEWDIDLDASYGIVGKTQDS